MKKEIYVIRSRHSGRVELYDHIPKFMSDQDSDQYDELIGKTTIDIEEEKKEVVKETEDVQGWHFYYNGKNVNFNVPIDSYGYKLIYKIKE